MNILPKKRWHVRTRENIARVRRDEAKALEEETVKKEKIKLAEREARRELLLQKSRKSSDTFIPLDIKTTKLTLDGSKHINFFEELEDGVAEEKHVNTEHEKEKKEEKEKYEKQIGYLTYLGQDTNEALGKKSWYNVLPDRSDVKNEVNLKSKSREDPLKIMKKFTETKNDRSYKSTCRPEKPNIKDNIHAKKVNKHKNRKRKYSSSSNSSSEDSKEKSKQLEILRLKRLKRENEERKRTEELLASLNPKKDDVKIVTEVKAKYNSQFNPHLAKQNYIK